MYAQGPWVSLGVTSRQLCSMAILALIMEQIRNEGIRDASVQQKK